MGSVCPDRPARRVLSRTDAAGPVRCGRITKQLVYALRAGEMAVIAHDDLDSATAAALIRCAPAAIINTGCLLTGRVPVQGARLLLEAGIPVLDQVDPACVERLEPGQWVRLEGDRLVDRRGRVVAVGVRLALDEVERRLDEARTSLPQLARRFVDNTLHYLHKEAALLTDEIRLPPLTTPMAGRAAVVVVRSQSSREDLAMVLPFIRSQRPVLIGVDGGADDLLAAGLRPDLLVGDMDSCSDRALALAREVVVHAYPNGVAPGLARVRRFGRFAHVLPAGGTSEDVALLLAYAAGARPIVAVGAHWGLLDFVERGRPGMASTVLVRMRVGHVLVDARGLGKLWPSRPAWRSYAPMMAAAASSLAALALVSDPLRLILRLLWVRLQAGLWVGGVP